MGLSMLFWIIEGWALGQAIREVDFGLQHMKGIKRPKYKQMFVIMLGIGLAFSFPPVGILLVFLGGASILIKSMKFGMDAFMGGCQVIWLVITVGWPLVVDVFFTSAIIHLILPTQTVEGAGMALFATNILSLFLVSYALGRSREVKQILTVA